MKRTTLLFSIFLMLVAGRPAFATCGPTTITVGPPTPGTHNAYYITDPSGQQTAVFDLRWGGTLSSLTLDGVQTAWGSQTGGMIQPAMFAFPSSQAYNPTEAGDVLDHGSSVTGVYCMGTTTL